jgi:predicted secreted protein
LREAIEVRLGDERTITLPSLSGAGYAWSVGIESGDGDIVAVRELDPDASPGPPGESPDHVFGLSARRAGSVVLRFEHRRPWEADTPAREVRLYEVTVAP